MLKIVKQPAFYSLGFLFVFSIAAFIYICTVLIPRPGDEIQAQTQWPAPEISPPPEKSPDSAPAKIVPQESPPRETYAFNDGKIDLAISATLRDIRAANLQMYAVPSDTQRKYALAQIPLSQPASSAKATPEPAAFALAGSAIATMAASLLRRRQLAPSM